MNKFPHSQNYDEFFQKIKETIRQKQLEAFLFI